jgi:glycerate kinase
MKRVLIAFDKFKDALSARAACEAAARGLRASHPDWEFDLCPLTDGGDGFCETLTKAAHGRLESHDYSGPRGSAVPAPIGYVSNRNLTESARARLGLAASGTLAVIEMAAASGIALLPPDRRDPWHTSSYGTGEQLRAAAKNDPRALLLGVGGSATNDLAFGALAALGVKFLDADGTAIAHPVPAMWEKIRRIEMSRAIQLPPLFIACDVSNPLLGPQGAAAIFGPQKGLRSEDLPRLETQAARLATLLCEACHQSLALTARPGAGAAGGIAFGLMASCNAKLIPGFALVSDWLDLPARVAQADLILTGEGRFDSTSLNGKGPGALVESARHLGKPIRVFAGSVQTGLEDRHVHPITPAGTPLADALARTAEFLETSVRTFFQDRRT